MSILGFYLMEKPGFSPSEQSEHRVGNLVEHENVRHQPKNLVSDR